MPEPRAGKVGQNGWANAPLFRPTKRAGRQGVANLFRGGYAVINFFRSLTLMSKQTQSADAPMRIDFHPSLRYRPLLVVLLLAVGWPVTSNRTATAQIDVASRSQPEQADPVRAATINQPADPLTNRNRGTTATVITPKTRDRLSTQRGGLNPRNDGWESEAFAEEAESVLQRLLKQLAEQDYDSAILDQLTSADFACAPLRPRKLQLVFRDESVMVRRGDLASLGAARAIHRGTAGLTEALRALAVPFDGLGHIEVNAKIIGLATQANISATSIIVELSGRTAVQARQVHAQWDCLWSRMTDGPPRLSAIRTRDYEEATTLGERGVWFDDCTESVLGDNPSFGEQLVFGLDHWLKRIERTHRMHVFAASGLAVGDANGDGLDDLYVCQPGGLPNRLFLQTPEGLAVDHSVLAGVDWLDSTSSALFLDVDNDADQDLVLATLTGLLVMENSGTGRFRLQAILPTGGADMQSLSAADYDNDGDLDIYICLNFPKVSTERLASSSQFAYHDANDGAANRLFRNDVAAGVKWKFVDVTQSVGLDAANRRHSLAAAWEDYDNDGDVDLYVANDYGRNCLYRNDGDTFVDVAAAAGVVDFGSGMSVSWSDYNRDGRMDLYVGNMFSSAGSRITPQPTFRPGIDDATRRVLRRFAKGNTLFQNVGDGRFRDVGAGAAVEIARWAWSSIFLDLNNSGWEDVFVANGYITTEDPGDL